LNYRPFKKQLAGLFWFYINSLCITFFCLLLFLTAVCFAQGTTSETAQSPFLSPSIFQKQPEQSSVEIGNARFFGVKGKNSMFGYSKVIYTNCEEKEELYLILLAQRITTSFHVHEEIRFHDTYIFIRSIWGIIPCLILGVIFTIAIYKDNRQSRLFPPRGWRLILITTPLCILIVWVIVGFGYMTIISLLQGGPPGSFEQETVYFDNATDWTVDLFIEPKIKIEVPRMSYVVLKQRDLQGIHKITVFHGSEILTRDTLRLVPSKEIIYVYNIESCNSYSLDDIVYR